LTGWILKGPGIDAFSKSEPCHIGSRSQSSSQPSGCHGATVAAASDRKRIHPHLHLCHCCYAVNDLLTLPRPSRIEAADVGFACMHPLQSEPSCSNHDGKVHAPPSQRLPWCRNPSLISGQSLLTHLHPVCATTLTQPATPSTNGQSLALPL
jgi:hypothetical protein